MNVDGAGCSMSCVVRRRRLSMQRRMRIVDNPSSSRGGESSDKAYCQFTGATHINAEIEIRTCECYTRFHRPPASRRIKLLAH